MGKCFARVLRDKVQPAADRADQRKRNEPSKLQVAHLGGLKPRHAHAAAHKLAKQQVGAQTAGNRNAVDHRLLRLGQLDGDLAGRGLIVGVFALVVGVTGKRCHKAKDGRGKERRQRGLSAQQRKLPKLGAKATHAVAQLHSPAITPVRPASGPMLPPNSSGSNAASESLPRLSYG